MNKYKVGVYAICKNEEKFVDGWMDSMGEADSIVVTDTGSEDETVKRLRERGAEVFEEKISPWRFDTARNISLAHVPPDTDIAVCTDLDERFHPGWRAALERSWRPEATMGNYLYNWSLKPDGSPDVQFSYFKIHRPGCYRWRCPVHEHLEYIGEGPERAVWLDGVVLDHHPDEDKPRASYLPLLELAVGEEPESDRMAHYLGREYMYAGRWRDAIAELRRHLTLPGAAWLCERSASMRWLGYCHSMLGDTREAKSWYYRAIAEAPFLREPYVDLARLAYSLGDWETALYMSRRALEISEKSDSYINMGYAWDHTPDDIAAIACYKLGLFAAGEAHARRALSLLPGDGRLEKNLRIMEELTGGQAGKQTEKEPPPY